MPDGTCSHVPVSCDDGSTCTQDACSPAAGCVYTPIADGTLCNDGDASRRDRSLPGWCVRRNNPVVCGATDDCHAAGTCDASTGLCSNPVQPDGTGCGLLSRRVARLGSVVLRATAGTWAAVLVSTARSAGSRTRAFQKGRPVDVGHPLSLNADSTASICSSRTVVRRILAIAHADARSRARRELELRVAPDSACVQCAASGCLPPSGFSLYRPRRRPCTSCPQRSPASACRCTRSCTPSCPRRRPCIRRCQRTRQCTRHLGN